MRDGGWIGPRGVDVRAAGDSLELIVGELVGAVPEVREHYQSIELRPPLDEFDPEVTRDGQPERGADRAARIDQKLLTECAVDGGPCYDAIERASLCFSGRLHGGSCVAK
jgi:hypothetical protein